jgi:hypothetical protein
VYLNCHFTEKVKNVTISVLKVNNMNSRISKEEKSALITGKFTLKATFIGGLITLIGIILTWWLTSRNESTEQSKKQDSIQININNNRIQQSKSQNGNIQIGNNNVSK